MIFFFQAEDGIRDYKVTGVQTCALPISARSTMASMDPVSGRPDITASRVGSRTPSSTGGITSHPRLRGSIAPAPFSASSVPRSHDVVHGWHLAKRFGGAGTGKPRDFWSPRRGARGGRSGLEVACPGHDHGNRAIDDR